MRNAPAFSVAVALAGSHVSAARAVTPEHDGPRASTVAPDGRTLGPDDPHRKAGSALAAPIIRGRLSDKRAPALLYLHGGGWVITGRAALAENTRTIARWSARGVAVWGADYRRDRLSLADADAAYRALRRRVGARRRICVMGESSGGTLALLLAAKYPKLRCVVTYAGVGDLRRLTPGPLATEVRDWLLPFGGYPRWDPLTNARRILQPVLLIHHADDTTVSAAQSRRLHDRLPRSSLIQLVKPRAGGVQTTHGDRTSATAERAAFAVALRLVRGPAR